MSVAALSWTFNDGDILEATVRHMLAQVDEVLIRHRPRYPEVQAMLEELAAEEDRLVLEIDDGALGWSQSAIITELAQIARLRGHSWVVPFDADEVWYANGHRLGDFLDSVPQEVEIVSAELFNHVRTPDDPEAHPFVQMGWREREPIRLPKVAARTGEHLTIAVGNHSAWQGYWTPTVGPYLVARHFPYRNEDQFIERVRTANHELVTHKKPEGEGIHIRTYARWLHEGGEEALRRHFRKAFIRSDPENDKDLIYDPAPVAGM